MADKDGVERKVWLLPTELSERIKAYQASQGITSEVEAARRLLDSALQLRDTVPDILRKLADRFSEEKDLRVLAKDVLVSHTLVIAVHIDSDSVWFEFKDGELGRIDKHGKTYVGEAGSGFEGSTEWTVYPRPTRQPASRAGIPSWDPPKGGDLDDEIPF
jgi:hypothetical protein